MTSLERGDQGQEVSELHQLLIEQGFNVGEDAADKIFGRDTYDAVAMFQASHLGQDGKPLKVDGSVGPKTRWAIENPTGTAQSQAEAEVPASGVQRAANKFTDAMARLADKEVELGVKETPNGSNRGERIDVYTGFEGRDPAVKGPPWCAYFVSHVVKAAADELKVPVPFRIGNAQNIGHWAAKRSYSLIPGAARPMRGDIFIIARDEVHGHTGIIKAAQGDAVWTCEGNAGNAVKTLKRSAHEFSRLVRLPGQAIPA